MTYWNEIGDKHIRLWDTELYPSHYNLRHEFTDEGYRGDKLQSSEVIFLGSCDVMTNLVDGTKRWSAMVHNHKYVNCPFIALGTVATGLPSMVRRLYAYIENFGPPKCIYMTIPRFDGYEFVNKSGKCYNVSSRAGSARFCRRADFITDDELDIWLTQLSVNKRLQNLENCRYILEERFAFIETLCKLHKIELRWSFNPSDAGIYMLHKNITIFEDINNFMKESFVGLAGVIDHQYDRSIGPGTHAAIYNRFISPLSWNYDTLKSQAEENYNWLTEKYGDELIKMEN